MTAIPKCVTGMQFSADPSRAPLGEIDNSNQPIVGFTEFWNGKQGFRQTVFLKQAISYYGPGITILVGFEIGNLNKANQRDLQIIVNDLPACDAVLFSPHV